MENIENGSIIRRINKCNHYFHIGCIDKWFETKITCPTCRQDIRELSNVNDTENETDNSGASASTGASARASASTSASTGASASVSTSANSNENTI